MRCWKVVAIACGIGKIAVVYSRLHDTFVSSNDWLLDCLSFLDWFRLRSFNMMDREIGGSNSESKSSSKASSALSQSTFFLGPVFKTISGSL